MINKQKTLIIALLAIFATITSITVEADGPYIDDAWVTNYSPTTLAELNALPDKMQVGNYAYTGFRVDAVSENGTIITITFGENSGGDGSACDLYLQHSFNNGLTWTTPTAFLDGVEDYSGADYDAFSLCQSRLFFDNDDRLWCAVELDRYPTWSSELFMVYSDDLGETWVGVNSTRHMVNLSEGAIDLNSNCSWKAAIGCNRANINNLNCLSTNRLIMGLEVSCSFSDTEPFTIYCDDPEQGSSSTWHVGEVIDSGSGVREKEATVEEIRNGSYTGIMAIRSGSGWKQTFSTNFTDGTVDWGAVTVENAGIDDSQCRVMRWTKNSSWGNYDKNVLLCNVRDTYRMLYISYDEGGSWDYAKTMQTNEICGVYGMCVAKNGTVIIGITNGSSPTRKITQFNMEWLSDGNDKLNYTPSSDGIQFISINGGSNSTTIYNSTPTINWTVVDNTSQYWLQIDNNQDFSSPEVNLTDINEINYPTEFDENSTRVSLQLPVANALSTYDTYYCRVKAYVKS